MPKGTSESDKVQSTVEKLEEYERKIDIKIDDWCEAKLDIEKAIHTVESDKLRLLLRYRYINGWTFEQIAVQKMCIRDSSIMCTPAPWAKGLPLNADGFTTNYYKKD